MDNFFEKNKYYRERKDSEENKFFKSMMGIRVVLSYILKKDQHIIESLIILLY